MLAFIKQFVGGMLSKDIGIDLGTCNTVVYVRGEGIILNEPTVVALNRETNKVALNGEAVGKVAKDMLGKTSGKVVAVRPMKDGVVTDFDVTAAMVSYFIRKAQRARFGAMPRVVIAVPKGITKVEKRAVVNAAEKAGARRVFLIDEPLAAAIGAGLPILEPIGTMIVDIGGGTAEIAIIACGEVNSYRSIRIAGDEFSEAIAAYLKTKYGLVIGELTSERLKIEIGSVMPLPEEQKTIVRGLDFSTRTPRELTIGSEEIRQALLGPAMEIIRGIREVIDKTMPEIAADLMQTGITLAGGSSLLRGLDALIQREINIPVRRAEDPISCVARGTGMIIENLDKFKDTLESDEDIL